MKNFIKIPMLVVMVVLIVTGSAMALSFPFIPLLEVEGHVSTSSALYKDNGDGTASFKGVEYTFSVINSEVGGGLDWLVLEFENEAFSSVNYPYAYDPSSWKGLTTTWSANDNSYTWSIGDTLVPGQQLSFLIDVDLYISALTDDTVWQEGHVWSQSWIGRDRKTGAFDGGSTSPQPEPATMLLLGTGLAGMVAMVRRRKVRKA